MGPADVQLTLHAPAAWVAAFAAGLVSFFSPCTLPLLPAYLSYLTGIDRYDELVSSGSRRHILPHAVLFIAGFSTIFVILGGTATALGSLVSDYTRTFEIVGGLLITVFGVFLTGVLPISALYRDVRWRPKARPAGFVGSFVIGAAFAAGWSPCVGPILAFILALASQAENVGEGMAFLAVYSLGLGIPFLVCSLALERFMGWIRTRGHLLGRLEKATGVLLAIIGLAMITGLWARLASVALSWSITPKL